MAAAAPENKPVLGYWAIRGLAHPIRFLFAHLGVDFEDVQYECTGSAEEGWGSPWYGVKGTLGLELANLPYIIHGDVKVTQSVAVLTYAAEEFGLHNDFTNGDKARALMFAEQVMDIRNPAVGLFYGGAGEASYVADATGRFAKLSAVLKDGWLMGDKLCAADFHLAEMVDLHQKFDASIFAGDNECLLAYRDRLFGLDGVKEYIANNAEIPYNNRMARWGAEVIA